MVYKGQVSSAENLLKDGFDPNQEYNGDQLLWRAILSSSKPAAMTKLLLQYQADPNAKRPYGTMLSEGCSAPKDSDEIVNLLLNARADIKARSKQGRTPLRDAVKENTILTSATCLHRLLDEPTIELDHPTWKEKPACTLATRISFNASHLSVFARMLDLGADPNGNNQNGRTIFTEFRTWFGPNYVDPYDIEFVPNLPVLKSALLILDAHRIKAKQLHKDIKKEITLAGCLPHEIEEIVTQFTCPLIAPDDKELDETLALYKDYEPVVWKNQDRGDRKEN